MTDHPIPFSAPMVAALRACTKTQTRREIRSARVFATPESNAFTLSGDSLLRALQGASRFRRLDGNGWFWESDAFEWQAPATRTGWMAHIGFAPGDRLWVRESYYQSGHWAPIEGGQTKGGRQKWGFVPADDVIAFDQPGGELRLGRHSADPGTVCWHKRLGRFMPRAASRMTLLVTGVRVQRLQDISEGDAIAEGVWNCLHPDGRVEWRPNPDNRCINKARYAYSELWQQINGVGSWAKNPWVVAYSFTVEHRNIDAEG